MCAPPRRNAYPPPRPQGLTAGEPALGVLQSACNLLLLNPARHAAAGTPLALKEDGRAPAAPEGGGEGGRGGGASIRGCGSPGTDHLWSAGNVMPPESLGSNHPTRGDVVGTTELEPPDDADKNAR